MPATYLFRIDMNKDNDAFFKAHKSSASHVYAGIAVSIGSSTDWIPDLIEIVVVDESKDIKLTLIELDATESIVRTSCRKYLPENSTDIVCSFCKYLDRVITQCQSSAHPHQDEFIRLKTILEVGKVTVITAGALRSSTGSFIEKHSLIDQPERIVQMQSVQEISRDKTPEEISDFRGTLRLSADKSAALGRAILVLDAVIRQCDHGGGAFAGWRKSERTQPLKKLLKKDTAAFPFLYSFISEKAFTGVTLDFEKLVPELVAIWSDASNTKMTQERVRSLINGYFPIASQIRPQESMPVIFEMARKFLAGESKTCLKIKQAYRLAMSKERAYHSDPEILGGTLVFKGTRVPVRSLFDHLKAGDSIEVFLDGFPSVKRSQVLDIFDFCKNSLAAN